MPESLEKLRPDRDLQCFFFRPSSIAALSETSEDGFTVSGTWRQQFDWAVIEWNRDNVYEHPAFRYLPDGDLSGLTLTYEEERTNCIPLDSSLFPTVDWPFLRVWAGDNGAEEIYFVPLKDHATPIAGSYQCAYADFTLSGTATGGDYIGLAFLTEHHTYQLFGSDTLESAVQALVDSVNAFSSVLKATRTGATIRLHYTGGTSIAASTEGANGNRFGVYSYTSASATSSWNVASQTLANGTSPTKWEVSLDFSSLVDRDDNPVPMDKVRKMRWTYAANLQFGEFARSEFEVVVSNWTVTGTGRGYSVAGPTSRRFEDDDAEMVFSGSWTRSRGNYSGGTIQRTVANGASVSCSYVATGAHTLYLGTRYTGDAADISVSVDSGTPVTIQLSMPGEDVLVRLPLGSLASGPHTFTATHAGSAGEPFFFDFVELAVPTTDLPTFPAEPLMTLATDWDTDHSLAIAPERTAWFIDSLGFRGRQNHYVGALLFYEMTAKDHEYASGSVTFSGTPDPNESVTIRLGRVGQPPETDAVLSKLIHIGSTPATLAAVFAMEINSGYTGIRAEASSGVVTFYSRSMGEDGNDWTLEVSTTSANLTVSASGETFTGGEDGTWITDITATPKLNRAVRDWSRSFFVALEALGIDSVSAFSTELKDGDPTAEAGIAQMGPAGDPILLPTPALQTNFSPTSLNFWKEVHREMAAVQVEAGMQPYLQFGEVQWWYFPHDGLGLNYSGMPFYDPWTKSQFQTLFGRPLPEFTTNTADPEDYPDEVQFLSGLIGDFTDAIIAHVRATYSNARFEVLYPTDVNQTAFNRAINYPESSWTPAALECLKTESLGFTFNRDLKASETTIDFGADLGFAASKRAHLVGIGDSTAPWLKEARIAQGRKFESVVLFALDQFCLIGYRVPLEESFRRSVSLGGA